VKRALHALGIVAILGVMLSALAEAQDPAPQKAAPTPKPPAAAPSNPISVHIPLRLQFVISKYQGEKKISSLPYSISLNANGPRVGLRMGARVPYTTTQVSEGKAVPSFSYEQVGVNIDSGAFSQMDGAQFRVDITVEDSSIATTNQVQGAPQVSGIPIFRHFRISNNVLLRDGQTTQVTTAADPISGEVMRVDVTLTVVK
jgi:type II/III secretion system protein